MTFILTLFAVVALCALTYRFVLIALPAAMGFQVSLAAVEVEASAPEAALLGIFAASCVWFVHLFFYANCGEARTQRVVALGYGAIAGLWCYALVVQALELSTSSIPMWQHAVAACCGLGIGLLSVLRFAALPIAKHSL
jgi:hypothetical protein